MIRTSFFCRAIAAMLCLLAFKAPAQYFYKYYETTYDRTARDIMRTNAGEYLIVGYTNNSNPSDADLYVMLTDAMGNKLWDTAYGGGKIDFAYNMTATDDGNYIVVGYTQSFGGGDLDMYLMKITPKGKFIKQRAVDINNAHGNDEARQVIRTADNHYLVIGSAGMPPGSGHSDMALLKIDNNLDDVEAPRTYGNSNDEFGEAISIVSGGYLICGQTFSKGSNGDAYVIKLDGSLNKVADMNYGTAHTEEIVGLVSNSDGTSMLAIRDSVPDNTTSDGGNIDIDLLKINNSDLSAISTHTYGGGMKDTPKSIQPVSTGGYIVGAISRSWWNAIPQMWIIRCDANGDTNNGGWIHDYGDPYEHDHCHMAKESFDGGFIAVGHRRQGATLKIAFLKMDAGGYVGLKEESLSGEKFGIFPNPAASGKFTVELNDKGYESISVYDVVGNRVYLKTLESAATSVDVNLGNAPAGIYIVSIMKDGNRIAKRMIVE